MTTQPPDPGEPGPATWWSPPDPAWPPPQPTAPRRSRVGLWVTLAVVAVLAVPTLVVVAVYVAGQTLRTGDPGAPASSAGCLPDTFEDGSDNRHVAIGEPIEYPRTPPASGRHWGNFLQGSEIRTVYTVADRPAVERLVHSLEHGYTILWYDADIADDPDRMAVLRDIAADAPTKFMAAPWTAADGDPFPAGIDVVLAHWSFGDRAGGAEPAALGVTRDGSEPVGVRRACAELSAEVVADFMTEYPFTDSLEPYAP